MASDCDTTLETLASIVCEHLTLVEGCSDGLFVRLAECAFKYHVINTALVYPMEHSNDIEREQFLLEHMGRIEREMILIAGERWDEFARWYTTECAQAPLSFIAEAREIASQAWEELP